MRLLRRSRQWTVATATSITRARAAFDAAVKERREDMPVKNWMPLSPADLHAALFANPKGEHAEKFFQLPTDHDAHRRPRRLYLVASLHRQIRLAASRQRFEKTHPPHFIADADRLGQSRRCCCAGLCR
ncbi:MAG TPA: hypothetical protein VNZ48_11275 [Xanthobacteraceae bacterium]|jgi:hypothetical protein|nr:hypothetical protein [Xanthobacteraceae bacterium]